MTFSDVKLLFDLLMTNTVFLILKGWARVRG